MSSRSLDLFFRACEVAGPPSLRVGSEPEPRVMSSPFAVVGCDPGSDLVIADPALSPRHCYLQALGSKVLCIDLGSANGLANGDGPASACWIDPSHVARVGRQVIGIDGGFGGPDESDRPGSASGDLDEDGPVLARPMPRLVLEFETNAIRTRWRMRRAVALVGSAPGCAVRLNGPSVARYHCALVLTGQGLWVVDLLGRLEPPGRPGSSSMATASGSPGSIPATCSGSGSSRSVSATSRPPRERRARRVRNVPSATAPGAARSSWSGRTGRSRPTPG